MQVHTITTPDNVHITYATSAEMAAGEGAFTNNLSPNSTSPNNPNNINNKPWLIFVVPFGIKVALAEPFFEHFAAQYQVLVWESRLILSHSDENTPQSAFDVACHVADLEQIMAACQIQSAALVGYCSGAGVALKAAQTMPQVFSHLVLVSGEYTLLDQPDCMTQFGQDVDSLLPIASESHDSAQFIIDRLSFLSNPNVPDGVHRVFSNAEQFQQFAKSYLSYKSQDYAALARQIALPTLVIAGEADEQTTVSSSAFIQAQIANSQFYVSPSADHYALLRPQSEFFQRIDQFLQTGEAAHE